MKSFSQKVLIVEDDILLSVIEKRLVQNMGYEVVATTDSGEEALDMVREKKPDIILMDVKLKGSWDGIETVKEIRKNFSIPIIYLSGCSDGESRKRAEALGFSGFLSKPLQINDLQKAFDEALKKEHINKPEIKSSRKHVGYS